MNKLSGAGENNDFVEQRKDLAKPHTYLRMIYIDIFAAIIRYRQIMAELL